ncbi:killer suppression protein HigA [bacterium]|nr:killer suppression protein HigA [bacterium]
MTIYFDFEAPMEIAYKSNRLRKAFERQSEANRQWGQENARKLLLRFEQLRAAPNLALFAKFPGTGFHALKGRRQNQFACYGKHPYRLIFEVDHDPPPRSSDGGIDFGRVTRIRLLEVVDYHGD